MPMQIGTEIFGSQFPVVFDRFETLIGKRLWQKRATAIRAEVRGNPYLKEWLLQENRLAMVLDRYSAHKQEKSVSPTINIVDSQEYEAVSFVSQSLVMLDSVDSATASALLGRVKGCFQNPSDLQGLAFEILTATHLKRRGAEVHLPADGTYDWFSINQSLPFEVECKSISNDKGRQVHFRAALDLQHLIKRELKGAVSGMTKGLVVRVTVPGRLSGAYQDQKHISGLTRQAILSARDTADAAARISVESFTLSSTPFKGETWESTELRSFLLSRFGINNQHAIAIGTRSGGVLVLVIGSDTPEDLLGETMSTIGEAASRQLTGTRPGIVCVKLEGLTADELVEIGSENDRRPSPLRIRINRLMQSTALDHMAWVAFVADGDIETRSNGAFSRMTSSYSFWNPRSPFKGDNRLQLFGMGSAD
jgi:hypothetical protein